MPLPTRDNILSAIADTPAYLHQVAREVEARPLIESVLERAAELYEAGRWTEMRRVVELNLVEGV